METIHEVSRSLFPFNVVRSLSSRVPSTPGLRATLSKQERAGLFTFG